MPCPPDIAELVAEILTTGLLRIRAMGWNNNPARCAIEADHLHNLPGILADYAPELLESYWRAERIAFIRQSSAEELRAFQPLWQSLGQQVRATPSEVVPS